MTDPERPDTIVAPITPPGEGGIAALRLAGPDSRRLAAAFFKPSGIASGEPLKLQHGHYFSTAGEILDEVMIVYMPDGHSYTGLEQVELFCHGGRQVVRLILEDIIARGARPAEAGEFTKLAFLNGRIDLARAEAVAEIVSAQTRTSYEAGRQHLIGSYSAEIDLLRSQLIELMTDLEAVIDFEEELSSAAESSGKKSLLDQVSVTIKTLIDSFDGGRIIREGFQIAIGGRTNAGKSSLFNKFLRQERALVDPEAGTTRDFLSEWIELEGLAVNLIDTAGLRESAERVEKLGQERSTEIIDRADLTLWMVDLSQPDWEDSLAADLPGLQDARIVLIGNKIDLLHNDCDRASFQNQSILGVSCKTGDGLDNLKAEICRAIEQTLPDLTSGQIVTSARHQHCLQLALDAIDRATASLQAGESEEIVAFSLRQAAVSLGEITGKVYNEEILAEVFSRFCIGK